MNNKPYNNSSNKAACAVFKRLENWCAETSSHVIGYTGICRPETVTEYPTKMWECNLEDGIILEADGMADTLAGAIEQALDRIGASMIKHYIAGAVYFRPMRFVPVWVTVGNCCWMEYRLMGVR